MDRNSIETDFGILPGDYDTRPTRTRVFLVAAVSENGVIGKDGGLPWHIPGDLLRFRTLTFGNTVIMGRKTHESIGRCLPGRKNIVLTRNQDMVFPGAFIASKLSDVLTHTDGDLFVIGGESVYREFLPAASRLYLTRVHTVVHGGDAFFPALDDAWHVVSEDHREAGAGDEHPYTFVTMERR